MIQELSLKSARVNAKLDQKDVTKSIRNTLNQKVSRQRLSRWENGNYGDMPVDIAFYLSKLYKMPFNTLFYGVS